MPKDIKNAQPGSLTSLVASNLTWALNEAAGQINSASTSISENVTKTLMKQTLNNMPYQMGQMLLYGITADSVGSYATTINGYVQAARKSYESFIAKFTSPMARNMVEAAISYMFPPVFAANVASYSLDAFVNMNERDKKFIVQTLLPKMSVAYQQEYWQILCAKKDSEFKTSLVKIVKDLAGENALCPALNTMLIKQVAAQETKKPKKTFFPSMPSFFRPRRDSSESTTSSVSDKSENKDKNKNS